MSKEFHGWRQTATTALVAFLAASAHVDADAAPKLQLKPAEHWQNAMQMRLYSATLAGSRLVAVGDHGIILLSDDNGRNFRQARSVPVDSTLTSVSFADARNGWAVGHWGVILSTRDAGETWQLQRSDVSVDQPLFSVHFETAQKGVAVGLWSLALTTDDGGKTWKTATLPPPPGSTHADRNLYTAFAGNDALYVSAERGYVLKTTDNGSTWSYVTTGFPGSLWTGAVATAGMCVGGLRGHLLCNSEQDASWKTVDTGTTSSIVSVIARNGKIVAATIDGQILDVSPEGAVTKHQSDYPDALIALQCAPNGSLWGFGAAGAKLISAGP